MNEFATNVRKELGQRRDLSNKRLVKAELKGYLLTILSNEFSTESEYNINRFSKLLSNIGYNDFSISIKGKKYTIKLKSEIDLLKEEITDIEEKKAFVRGAFLGAGTITDPQKGYHLEMVFNNDENAKDIKEILNDNEIISNIIRRESKYLTYIDDGENIVNFLAFIGANKSVLEFEDTRVYKEVRNKVNRIVNYETANMNKTITSSVKQIEDIKFIKSKKQFEKLPTKEQELAQVRLNNPNASLKELGDLLSTPISKSGVNHRMQNISKFAEDLRKNKE